MQAMTKKDHLHSQPCQACAMGDSHHIGHNRLTVLQEKGIFADTEPILIIALATLLKNETTWQEVEVALQSLDMTFFTNLRARAVGTIKIE